MDVTWYSYTYAAAPRTTSQDTYHVCCTAAEPRSICHSNSRRLDEVYLASFGIESKGLLGHLFVTVPFTHNKIMIS